ncbi:MAG: helix-turn-helix transcriptional regulator [Erysipelotrichaceae bacterium]|nr:helix-turn-helix transcriptional regulator [Erysipelotrichaceae bacterium]
MNLGANICKARKDAHLTQADLAEKLHVSFQAVSCWEREQSVPDTYNFIELSKVLNVSLDWLVHNRVN